MYYSQQLGRRSRRLDRMRYVFLIIICFIVSCSSLKSNNKKAIRVFKKHIRNAGSGSLDDQESIKILERLTKSKCYIEQHHFGGEFKSVSTYNVNDWKEWLELNKSRLSFRNNSIYLMDSPKVLVKNPIEIMNQYVSDLKKMHNEMSIYVPDLDYILEQINDITLGEIHEYTYYFIDKNDPYSYISKVEKWVIENKHLLKWDADSQSIVMVRKS